MFMVITKFTITYLKYRNFIMKLWRKLASFCHYAITCYDDYEMDMEFMIWILVSNHGFSIIDR